MNLKLIFVTFQVPSVHPKRPDGGLIHSQDVFLTLPPVPGPVLGFVSSFAQRPLVSDSRLGKAIKEGEFFYIILKF